MLVCFSDCFVFDVSLLLVTRYPALVFKTHHLDGNVDKKKGMNQKR